MNASPKSAKYNTLGAMLVLSFPLAATAAVVMDAFEESTPAGKAAVEAARSATIARMADTCLNAQKTGALQEDVPMEIKDRRDNPVCVLTFNKHGQPKLHVYSHGAGRQLIAAGHPVTTVVLAPDLD